MSKKYNLTQENHANKYDPPLAITIYHEGNKQLVELAVFNFDKKLNKYKRAHKEAVLTLKRYQ